jgi:drug/metabolite transporter (DMT)-like permease
MTGAIWALAAGIGFGLFQSLNRFAVKDMDVYVATFIQLVVSGLVLAAASAVSGSFSLLGAVTARAFFDFGMAGFLHFFLGWTLMNISQQKIGAARTAALVGTTPLFAVLVDAFFYDRVPTWWDALGIIVIMVGIGIISAERLRSEAGSSALPAGPWYRKLGDSSYAIGVTVVWSLSPIFINHGLHIVQDAAPDSPATMSALLGLTLGMIPTVLGYLVMTALRGPTVIRASLANYGQAASLKVLAGVLVALATWARWIALELTTVAIVLSISQISVPMVIILAPLLVGKGVENVTLRVWIGALLTVGGSLVLVLT